ncbi:MAG: methyltransferase domain-containing protein [Pirellulales bacterium]
MGYERFAPVDRVIDVGGTSFTFWLPPDFEALIDVEAFERDERIPYWANVWESAVVLAEDVAVMEGCGRRFLELGCGLALPAMVAQRRGFQAVASDYEEDALEGVRFNADRNGAEGLQMLLLDWRCLPADLPTFDLVVAADVLYERHHADALAGVVARVLAPHGVALVTDPGRARAVNFEPAIRAAGLGVVKQQPRRPRGVATGPEIDIYRVTHPA